MSLTDGVGPALKRFDLVLRPSDRTRCGRGWRGRRGRKVDTPRSPPVALRASRRAPSGVPPRRCRSRRGAAGRAKGTDDVGGAVVVPTVRRFWPTSDSDDAPTPTPTPWPESSADDSRTTSLTTAAQRRRRRRQRGRGPGQTVWSLVTAEIERLLCRYPSP